MKDQSKTLLELMESQKQFIGDNYDFYGEKRFRKRYWTKLITSFDKESEDKHYFGHIIIQRLRERGSKNVFKILHGEQRLLVPFILLAAINKICKAQTDFTIPERLLFVETDHMGKRLKYQPALPQNREVLNALFFNDGRIKRGAHPYLTIFRYFEKKLKQNFDPDELPLLSYDVFASFKHTVYTVETEEDIRDHYALFRPGT